MGPIRSSGTEPGQKRPVSHLPTISTRSPAPSRLPASGKGAMIKPREKVIGKSDFLAPQTLRPGSRASCSSSGKTAVTPRTSGTGLRVPSQRPKSPQTSTANEARTPAAPRHKGKQQHVIPATYCSPPTSPYISSHVSDPCIAGSLIHKLKSCGHKVITSTPEKCGSNCQREFQPEVEKFANALVSEEPFVCAMCVEVHLEQLRRTRKESERARFEATKRRMGEELVTVDFELKMAEYLDSVLRNDLEKERNMLSMLGRPSGHIPGEALDEEAPKQQSKDSSVAWPPRKRPKQVRRRRKSASEQNIGGPEPNKEREESLRD